MEAGIDHDLLELRKAIEVGGVQRVDLFLRALDCRSRFEARNLLEIVAVPRVVRFLERRESQRPPQHHVVAEVDEVLRHHADDRIGVPVQPDFPPDDGRVAAKGRLPKTVAQDDLLVVALLAFVLSERPAKKRLHAQYAEEGWRHIQGADAGRGAVLIDVDARVVVKRLLLEDRDFPKAIEIVGHGDCAEIARACLRVRVADHHDPLRFGEREGPEDDVVDDREESDVGAKAESQRQRDGGAESTVLPEESEPQTKILPEAIHGLLG